MDPPSAPPPAPEPLVVVDSLGPLRGFLERATLPAAVLALREERPGAAGQGKGLDGEACVLLVNGGQPAVRLVDTARLAAMYGLAGGAYTAGNSSSGASSTPTTQEAAQPSSSPPSTSSRSPPLLAGLFSASGPQGARGAAAGNGRRRGGGGGGGGGGIGRTTADVFVPVPTPDPCGVAKQAVAAGATLEAMGATATRGGPGAARRERQHVLVRPPGGALVLVLTASVVAAAAESSWNDEEEEESARAPSPSAMGSGAVAAAAVAAGDDEGPGQEQEQEVGLEEGAAGIGSYFPTLRIEHKCCRNPGEVYANTPRPIPVETEAFAGHALLLIRDDSLSPPEPRHHYHMFEGKQRRFNIQVQGRLKRPVTRLYFGGEVTSKMELGLLAKGFAKTILGFIRALQPEMHHSFGDDDNVVLAHICAPLFQAAETFVLTPPGEAPPPLGENFPASDQDKLRRAGKLPAPTFEAGAIVSFSFHSMFIDFQSWRLVNFPLIRSLDLHLMWAKSALRFVVYEPGDAAHTQARNDYLYVLQLQHSSNLTVPVAAEEEEEEAEAAEEGGGVGSVAAGAGAGKRGGAEVEAAPFVARPLLRGTSLELEAEAEAAAGGRGGGETDEEGEEDEEEEEEESSVEQPSTPPPSTPPPPPDGSDEGAAGVAAAGADAARVVVENYFPASPSKKGRQRSLSGSASWFPPPPPGAAFADSKGQGSQGQSRRRRRRFLPLPRLRPDERSFALPLPGAAEAAEEEDDEEDAGAAGPTTTSSSSSAALARLLLAPADEGGDGEEKEDPLDLVPAWVEAAAVADGGGPGSGTGAMAAAVAAARRAGGRGGAEKKYRLWFAVCLGGRVCRLRGRKAILAALRPFAAATASTTEGAAAAAPAYTTTTSNSPNPRFSEREQQRRHLCGLVAAARRRARAGDAKATQALVALLGEPTPVDRAFLAGELLRPPPPAAIAASPVRGSGSGSGSTASSAAAPSPSSSPPTPPVSPPTSPLTAAKEAATGLIARTLSAPSLLLPKPTPRPSSSSPPIILTGPVARCLGDRHWAEERLVLTRVALSFYPPTHAAVAGPTPTTGADALAASASSLSLSTTTLPTSLPPQRLIVAVRDILAAAVCLSPTDGPPFPGGDFAYFEVATLGRVHTCVCRPAAAAAAWVAALEEAGAAARAGGEEGEAEAAGAFMSGYAVSASATLLAAGGGGAGTVAESFVAAPSHWALGDRVVLTARRPVLSKAARANIRGQDPCAVVSRLLQFGFTLDASSGAEEIAIFLDGAAALKHLDPGRLAGAGADEAEAERRKKAFFLNLYHTGVLLARLILGPPPANAALRWCGYYTSAAVEALGDVFSLAEIEHNVLRAPSPRARGALLRFLLPNTRYPRAFTPRSPDLRLNFALNCGSLSCPAAVPVYDPEALEAQLNLVTRFVLDSCVRVEERGRAVVLPKVCQWYARDFGGQLVPLLLQCLSPPKAAALRRMLAAGSKGGGGGAGEEGAVGLVAIKYAPFSFETRPLRRLDEEEEAMLMQM